MQRKEEIAHIEFYCKLVVAFKKSSINLLAIAVKDFVVSLGKPKRYALKRVTLDVATLATYSFFLFHNSCMTLCVSEVFSKGLSAANIGIICKSIWFIV